MRTYRQFHFDLNLRCRVHVALPRACMHVCMRARARARARAHEAKGAGPAITVSSHHSDAADSGGLETDVNEILGMSEPTSHFAHVLLYSGPCRLRTG